MQKTKKNYAVIIYEKNYPNPKGIATLVGIYPSHAAAGFIRKVVKDKFKLSFFPIIEPTDFEPTTYSVESFLERMHENKKDDQKD